MYVWDFEWTLGRNFIWSLIAISSCIGSIVAFNLAYFVPNRSQLFQLVVQCGVSCTICFYIFFPTSKVEKESKTGNQSKQQTLSKHREFFCIALCVAVYFLVRVVPFPSEIDLLNSSHHSRMDFHLHKSPL